MGKQRTSLLSRTIEFFQREYGVQTELDENNEPRGFDASAEEGTFTGEMHQPSEEEVKARGRRNIAIALAVVGFAVLIYLTTFFRLSQNIGAGAAG